MKYIDLLLLSIYNLSDKKILKVTIEDIVVSAFKQHPKIFQLKGYPEYPDSEPISKRIYDTLQPKGYIRVVNRFVQLTDHGIEYCQSLSKSTQKATSDVGLSRSESKHYQRLLNSAGFQIFLKEKEKKLLDVDLYHFYSISVKTNHTAIKGKIANIQSLISKAYKLNLPYSKELNDYKNKLDLIFSEFLKK